MPWAQMDATSERLRFVTLLRKHKSTFRSLCAAFGVAPKTGYKWLHQFEAAGPPGLQDRSRRPKSNSRAISTAVGERLGEVRRGHPACGPKTVVVWAERNGRRLGLPDPSTLGGFVH